MTSSIYKRTFGCQLRLQNFILLTMRCPIHYNYAANRYCTVRVQFASWIETKQKEYAKCKSKVFLTR